MLQAARLSAFARPSWPVLDTRRHEFRAALAGHPDPVLRPPGNTARVLPGCRLGLVGLNLGEGEGEPVARPFPPGACLVLVSDGVLDAGVVGRGAAFRVDRLLAAVASVPSVSQVASQILKAVARHVGGAAPEDDVTVAVIARTPAAATVQAFDMPLAA